MKRAKYEKRLQSLQAELSTMQDWIKDTGYRAIVVFEGRDAAGKGGTIKAITERVSPRVFRVVALPAPSGRERTQLYAQRYIEHFPSAGEIVIFDRSWYNRAGVEPVLGFCTLEERDEFLQAVPMIEGLVISEGIVMIKYWLEVSSEEQRRRFEKRMDDPKRQWKLSPTDLESRRLWYEYSLARDKMFDATDTDHAPWYIVRSDDKRRARLNCISHLLSQVPYETIARDTVKMPERSTTNRYDDQASMAKRRYIPEPY